MGIIHLLAERAKEVVAVMDSTKIGKRSRKKVLDLKQADRMVTDESVPGSVLEEYGKRGLVIE